MTTLNVEIYEAFLDAGAEDAKARAAANMVPSPNNLVSRANLAEVSSEMKTGLAKADTRLARVEIRLDGMDVRLARVEARLDEVETRLTRVEIRLDEVDSRLTRVETGLARVENSLDKLENSLLKSMLALGGILCGVFLGGISVATGIILAYLPSV